MSTHRQPPPSPSLHPSAFQRALRERVERDPGLCAALCALTFFRGRHTANPALTHADRVRRTRCYVAEARFHRFRGSVNEILAGIAAGGAR